MRIDKRFLVSFFAFSLLAASLPGCSGSDDASDGNGKGGGDQTKCARAATWELADDYLPGDAITYFGGAYGVATAPGGTVYVVGYSGSGSDLHWIVRKSIDQGKTWSVVDDFQAAPGEIALAYSVTVAASGKVFVAGDARQSTKSYWTVRMSSDEGATWQTVDSYQLSTGRDANARSIVTDASGAAYVAGYASSATGLRTWIVRKSATTGDSFATVDEFNYVSNHNSESSSIAIDGSGGLYVVGSGQGSSSDNRWIVRRSSDSGANWENVDEYLFDGNRADAMDVSATGDGKVVVVGNATETGNPYDSWLVRYSEDHGTTWSQLDLYQYKSQHESVARSVLLEEDGVLNVGGWGYSEDDSAQVWISRTASSVTSDWSTSDEYEYPSGTSGQLMSFAAADDGSLYAVGSSALHWITRVQRCE